MQQYIIYFVVQIVSGVAVGYLSISSCVPWTCSRSLELGARPYFLALQEAPGSSHRLPVPAVESAISPRNLGAGVMIL